MAMPDSHTSAHRTIPGSASAALSLLFVLLPVLLLVGAAATPNGGGSPSKRAGAPDDGDGSPGNSGTCNDAGCHNTFALNSGSGSIVANSAPFYAPGDTLAVEVIVDHPGAARYGFQITARDASGQPVGEWIPGETTRLTIGNPNYVTQKLASGVSSWTMRWVAPAGLEAGDITFYFAGNGADGRFNAANDHVYTGQSVVALSTTASTEEESSASFIDAVYPNPASETVWVRYGAIEPVHVDIYDLEGRLRESFDRPASGQSSVETAIDVSALPTGVYIVRLRSGRVESSQTVFVQR